jgi:hypothetical protein
VIRYLRPRRWTAGLSPHTRNLPHQDPSAGDQILVIRPSVLFRSACPRSRPPANHQQPSQGELPVGVQQVLAVFAVMGSSTQSDSQSPPVVVVCAVAGRCSTARVRATASSSSLRNPCRPRSGSNRSDARAATRGRQSRTAPGFPASCCVTSMLITAPYACNHQGAPCTVHPQTSPKAVLARWWCPGCRPTSRSADCPDHANHLAPDLTTDSPQQSTHLPVYTGGR